MPRRVVYGTKKVRRTEETGQTGELASVHLMAHGYVERSAAVHHSRGSLATGNGHLDAVPTASDDPWTGDRIADPWTMTRSAKAPNKSH